MRPSIVQGRHRGSISSGIATWDPRLSIGQFLDEVRERHYCGEAILGQARQRPVSTAIANCGSDALGFGITAKAIGCRRETESLFNETSLRKSTGGTYTLIQSNLVISKTR